MAEHCKRVAAWLLLCAVVQTTTVLAATSATPGLRVAVTNSGLAELKDIALPIINAALQDVSLPDVSLDEHVPVVGHVKVTLSSIKMTGFRLPSAALTVSSPPHFSMDMSGLTMAISMNYKWRRSHWPHASGHGSITAQPKGGRISVGMGITASGGHVVLTGADASVSFSDFSVKFHGKASWLYNLVVKLFKNSIKKSVQTAVQNQLRTAVGSSLNQVLSQLRTHQTLGGGKSRVDVDVGVVGITAGGSYLSMGDLLSIANSATKATCPLATHVLPSVAPGAEHSMLQLLLDDSFLNCISWVSAANGAMSATLTDADLPPQFPLRLNTSSWGRVIPALAAKYPNRPMQLALSPAVEPSITSSAAGMLGSMDYVLAFSVVTADGATAPVFTFNTSLALGVDVHAQMLDMTPTLTLEVTKLSLSLGVHKSDIGELSLAPIQSLFNTFLPLVQGLLNTLLKNGFPLPSVDGLSLVGPQVGFNDGFIAISSNFTFAAAALRR